jgi:hypothetical protein
MGLFGREEAEEREVAGNPLRCEICHHTRFWRREAQLNTAVDRSLTLTGPIPPPRVLCVKIAGTFTGSCRHDRNRLPPNDEWPQRHPNIARHFLRVLRARRGDIQSPQSVVT